MIHWCGDETNLVLQVLASGQELWWSMVLTVCRMRRERRLAALLRKFDSEDRTMLDDELRLLTDAGMIECVQTATEPLYGRTDASFHVERER